MASPLGHVLIAALAHRPGRTGRRRWGWLVLAGAATIAPDLDFVPGLLAGEINRFHHGVSHSLGAAALFGMLVALVAGALGSPRRKLGIAAASLYASHILLDLFTVDTRPPVGQPIFWPLSARYVALSEPFLLGIRHNADGGLGSFIKDVLSLHNLNAAAREVLLVAPVVLLIWLVVTRWTGQPSRIYGSRAQSELASGSPEPLD